MPTYSLLDPFEFPYYFYRIRGELIKVLSIIVCIPSTFCPTLGHLIYIYVVLFGPVKPEFGVIPTGQENH